MGLYQEIRPQNLLEIVGNKNIIIALNKMLQSKKRPHSILLYGPSGCGKTTIGRILAKEFGSNEDSIFEMNAANTRNVDDIREIAKTAGLSTLGGGSKTYIIDECQQLTQAAQQCLLKVLEETPKNCYFIFCTTDPQNLIPTIRNRCTDYEVSKLTQREILQLVQNACEKAQLNVSQQIREVVAATSEGSPRATLVALEKVKDIENTDKAIELLIKSTEQDPTIIELCKLMNSNPSVRKQKWSTIINLFDMLDDEPEKIRKSISTYLYKMLVTCKDEAEALDLAHLISIFSFSVFYGNKSQLGSLIVKACFQKNSFLRLDE